MTLDSVPPGKNSCSGIHLVGPLQGWADDLSPYVALYTSFGVPAISTRPVLDCSPLFCWALARTGSF